MRITLNILGIALGMGCLGAAYLNRSRREALPLTLTGRASLAASIASIIGSGAKGLGTTVVTVGAVLGIAASALLFRMRSPS